MDFDRPLAIIDIESTGVDPTKDRVIEFAVCVMPGSLVWQFRCNPGIPIPPEATAVHGITDADVAGCPSFSEFAGKIVAGLKGKDIGGYNLSSLDLPLLDEELRRCGLKLDLTGVRLFDAYGIFAKKEARSLADAVKKYCGRDHTNAHGAAADAVATADVLFGQFTAYPDLDAMTPDELAKFCKIGDVEYVDFARKFYRDADGDLVYAFSKQKGTKVRHDIGFAHWILGKDFTSNTKEILESELARIESEGFRGALGDALKGAGF